ncbi:hypothetical protein DV737_g2319, partial [Chaetothyriales sp. CBS 132003]
MHFFKELRRRSKASFHKSDSSTESNRTVGTTKSSSTLNSGLGSSTPPSTYHTNGSNNNLGVAKSNGETAAPSVLPRPTLPPLPSHSNRNSMIVSPSQVLWFAITDTPQSASPSGSTPTVRLPVVSSPFAPKVTSILDNSVVYQKVLLIYGEIGDPRPKRLDGTLTVSHDKDGLSFPSTSWPVSESYFKALVYLSPGWNKIRLDFSSPRLSNSSNGPAAQHYSYMMLNYLPLNSAPPLHLVILAGSDSPCTYDTVPQRAKQEGNDLEIAIRKFRMAAHLWQAFTAEQMFRNKFGRRCFRFDEEWQTGSLSLRDWGTGQMKNEAKVHLVRSNKTTAQLQDLQYAQQYGPAERKGELFSIAADAIKKYFQMRPGQKQYVAAMLIDSHWDPTVGTVRAHAALGGAVDGLHLAIFGSHALQSYPSCLEEVVPAFMDSTKTDTAYVANDCNESGSSWEAANIGIGAHLHEVGHLFGSPHQESGVMLRDYVRLNRSFLIREPYSTRTKSQGLKVCRMEDECNWHRLDVLRFRHHPCFRLPSDEPLSSQDESVSFFPVDNGKIICCASSGISFIEIYPDGEEVCKSWIDLMTMDPRSNIMPRQITLSEIDIRAKLPEDKRKRKIRLKVFCGASRHEELADIDELLSKKNIVSLPPLRQAPKRDEGLGMNTFNNMVGLSKSRDARQGFRSNRLGHSSMEGSKPQEVILESVVLQTKLLTSVKVYHGFALDGLEFCYEDGHTQLFGKRGGKSGGDEFVLGELTTRADSSVSLTPPDTRRGETILGFHLRAGAWIDGIEILTSTGRRSGMFGNAVGGSA